MWVTNVKIAALALVVIGFYTWVAHVIPQLESDVPQEMALGADVTPEQLVAAGEGVYNGAGGCVACHGLGTRAPNLLTGHEGQGPIGARCAARFGVGCKDYLYSSLTSPGDSVVPGFANIMPPMLGRVPGEQIWAVVAFLQSQGGGVTVTGADIAATAAATPAGAPGPPAAPASAATDARQLINELGCLVCHQLDGQGAQLGPPFDGIGRRLPPEGIRQGILDPNATLAAGYEQFAGVMPPNFGDRLTAAQLEAIVQFLATRR